MQTELQVSVIYLAQEENDINEFDFFIRMIPTEDKNIVSVSAVPRFALDGKAVKHYEGLPITMAAAVFPVFYLLSYVLSETAFFIFFSILIYVEAFLNMYKFKLKKPTSKWAYITACIIALTTIIIYVVLL